MKIPPNGPDRLKRIRADAMQLARDVRSWNENHPNDTPLDVGFELVVADLCDRGLRAAEAGDGEEYARIAGKLAAVVEGKDTGCEQPVAPG